MVACPKCGNTLTTVTSGHQQQTVGKTTCTAKTVTRYYCKACHGVVYETIA